MNGDISFQLNSETEPHFTLTCVSTGGPATTVAWTVESAENDSELRDRLSVVSDSATGEYTHTLNVTGRCGGNYTCTVSNSVPSEDTATIILKGILLFPLT